MIGCYDFCGHYEWTFAWLERVGGNDLVETYWDEGIGRDSQLHARELIVNKGFAGMAEYWGHTLVEESPDLGFAITQTEGVFRVDMHDCPSKGFLLRNGIEGYRDYCDHCIGWIGPMMRDAGFVIDHEHNHRGQCWWEMHRAGSKTVPAAFSAQGVVAGEKDVRLRPDWHAAGGKTDAYLGATSPREKFVSDERARG